MHEATESEQNFSTVMYMIENAATMENDESYKSPVDLLFDDLERVDPEHIAVKEYKVFKQASGVVCSKRQLNHVFPHGY